MTEAFKDHESRLTQKLQLRESNKNSKNDKLHWSEETYRKGSQTKWINEQLQSSSNICRYVKIPQNNLKVIEPIENIIF